MTSPSFGRKPAAASPKGFLASLSRKPAPVPVHRVIAPAGPVRAAAPAAAPAERKVQTPSAAPAKPAASSRPSNNRENYAGTPVWGRRVIARLIDELGVWLLIGLVFGPSLMDALARYANAGAGTAMETAATVDLIGFLFIFMVLQSGYNIAMEASPKQATLGKLLVGAAVTTRDGGKPSLASIILRNTVGRLACNVMPVFAGYLLGLFNTERRCVHDMIAGTVVRRRLVRRRSASGVEGFN